MTFPSWPTYSEEEIAIVEKILRSGKVNYWTGEEGKLFEKEFADYTTCQYAVAISNGTVALEAALAALEIKPGDEVITTPRTFMASASCIIKMGAKPIFADVDPVSQNITEKSIEKVITPKTKAIICVHLAGWPCDMDPINALAKKHELYVIEDCAQAHGAEYKGRPVGSLGDIAAFSFCQDKIMTTAGEGGMVTTSDKALWEKVWSFKDHGKSFDTVYRQEQTTGFKWLHESFGTNARMTEIQAAIGRIQLKKLPRWREIRTKNARIFNDFFKDVPGIRLTIPDQDIKHAYYKYYCFIKPDSLKPDWSRKHIKIEMNQAGLPYFSGSCSEIYLEKAFENKKLQPKERLPIAKKLGETSLMFLIHPTLSEKDIEKMAEKVRAILLKASLEK